MDGTISSLEHVPHSHWVTGCQLKVGAHAGVACLPLPSVFLDKVSELISTARERGNLLKQTRPGPDAKLIFRPLLTGSGDMRRPLASDRRPFARQSVGRSIFDFTLICRNLPAALLMAGTATYGAGQVFVSMSRVVLPHPTG